MVSRRAWMAAAVGLCCHAVSHSPSTRWALLSGVAAASESHGRATWVPMLGAEVLLEPPKEPCASPVGTLRGPWATRNILQ